MTDQQLTQLQEQNEQKRLAAIEKMGAKWLLHPSNHVKRKKRLRGAGGKFVK